MKLFVTVLLNLYLATPSWAVVAFDVASTPAEGTSTAITATHTVTGANTLLIACIAINGVNADSVTYNGDALTFLDRQIDGGGTRRVEVWYRIAPDTGGAFSLTVNLPSSQNAIIGGMSFTGVDQTTPIGTQAKTAPAGGTSASTTVTSSVSGMATDCLETTSASSAHTADAGQVNTSIRQGTGGNIDFASSTEPGATSVTMGWTWTGSSSPALIVVPINASPVGSRSPIFFQ